MEKMSLPIKYYELNSSLIYCLLTLLDAKQLLKYDADNYKHNFLDVNKILELEKIDISLFPVFRSDLKKTVDSINARDLIVDNLHDDHFMPIIIEIYRNDERVNLLVLYDNHHTHIFDNDEKGKIKKMEFHQIFEQYLVCGVYVFCSERSFQYTAVYAKSEYHFDLWK